MAGQHQNDVPAAQSDPPLPNSADGGLSPQITPGDPPPTFGITWGRPLEFCPGPLSVASFSTLPCRWLLLRRKTKDETFRFLSSNQTAMSLPADRQVGAAADHGR